MIFARLYASASCRHAERFAAPARAARHDAAMPLRCCRFMAPPLRMFSRIAAPDTPIAAAMLFRYAAR